MNDAASDALDVLPGAGRSPLDLSGGLRLRVGPAYPGVTHRAVAWSTGLPDAGFPVQSVRIVGRNVHMLEQVTGRLTTRRAALIGAATGVDRPGDRHPARTAHRGLGVDRHVRSNCDHRHHRGSRPGLRRLSGEARSRDLSSLEGLHADRYEVHVEAALAAEARALTSTA
jgi:hypothetical protein